MEAIFQFVDEVVEAQRDTYCAIADDIWDHPETRFEEFWSAQRLADALEAEGFQLTRDAGGIPNAFIASVGEGQPVIALLGEFDALAGLSQQAHSAEPTPLTPGANGHGCGHNLLGTAAFAAASLLAFLALFTLVVKSLVEYRFRAELKALNNKGAH